ASTHPAKPAFAFLIVPSVSWVLVATVIPIVALKSGTKTPLGRRILRGLAVLVILGVLAVAVLSGLLWKEQKRELTLPTPTGPLAVGRTIYVWADDAHSDALAPVPGTRRELLVWVWYPAAGQSGGTSDYVPVEVRL